MQLDINFEKYSHQDKHYSVKSPKPIPLQTITPNFLERFWAKVSKTDSCWIWIASKDCGGYGHIVAKSKGTLMKAHRASWVIHYGEIPEGLHVLHDCPGGDRRDCVNPLHLWLGTHDDNMNDKATKGKTGIAKISIEQVREIRELYRTSNLNQYQLASMFGLRQSCIGDVINRVSWKHVP